MLKCTIICPMLFEWSSVFESKLYLYSNYVCVMNMNCFPRKNTRKINNYFMEKQNLYFSMDKIVGEIVNDTAI